MMGQENVVDVVRQSIEAIRGLEWFTCLSTPRLLQAVLNNLDLHQYCGRSRTYLEVQVAAV